MPINRRPFLQWVTSLAALGPLTHWAQTSSTKAGTVSRDGVQIAYVSAEPDSGAFDRSKAVVFIHGALCDNSDWRFQFAQLARTHRVVALDLVGHGASEKKSGRIGINAFAKDVDAVCQQLGVSKVVLVAHSMGCRVALQCALDMPDKVASLVLLDGAYLSPQPTTGMAPAARSELAQATYKRVQALYDGPQLPAVIKGAFEQMFFDARFLGMRDQVVARAQSLPPLVARELMADFAAWDVLQMETALSTIAAPILAICSTSFNASRQRVMLGKDESTPWIQVLQQHARRPEIARYTDAGHFVMLEQPERIGQDMVRHLREINFGT